MEDADFSDAFCRFVQACLPTFESAELLVELCRRPDVAAAFALFALNQLLAAALVVVVEAHSMVYALRILGFVIIIGAIVDKNAVRQGRRRRSP